MDTPIINQPQVAILGTGALVKRPVVVADPQLGEVIAVRDMMYLSLSYDHRLVDGAEAARFLQHGQSATRGRRFRLRVRTLRPSGGRIRSRASHRDTERRLPVMGLVFLDRGLGRDQVDYLEAWDLQRRLHAEIAAATRPNTVILLEHASVYTAGKRTEPQERPLDGTPVIDVDRGGKITWHGPGQLVGYPLVRLPEATYVVDYVRRLEETLIRTLADFGLATGRVPGRSGVWLPADGAGAERKIAAIGVRVAAGTTMHGFALNVDPDLGVRQDHPVRHRRCRRHLHGGRTRQGVPAARHG